MSLLSTNKRVVGVGVGPAAGTKRLLRKRYYYTTLKFRHLIFAGFGLILIGYTFLVLSFIQFSSNHDKLEEQNNILLLLKMNQHRHEEEKHQIMKGESSSSKINNTNNGRRDDSVIREDANKNNINNNNKPTKKTITTSEKAPPSPLILSTFEEWKEYAGELAMKLPSEVLQILEEKDPFGVREFEINLQNYESNKGEFLNIDEISSSLFACPIIITTTKDGKNQLQKQQESKQQQHQGRITIPDYRNHTKATMFRNDTSGSYLFFQHLRKAGGTNFCTLAQHNLPNRQVPKYYCMPDMDWSNEKSAGYMSKYTNEDITSRMKQTDFRILGNEFDPFDSKRYFDLPGAIFATSFRKPLDRALSQFRFECIEDRGCSEKNVAKWWDQRIDLINIYTYTFSLTRRMRWLTIGTTEEAAKARKQAMLEAMDTISKFNLVLVMEWLAYSPIHVRDVLGFHDTSTMTERIRPHFHQAKRNDGQEHNSLGSAGISKASWDPKVYLSPQQYKRMSEDLALDAILTDAARRIFLERIVCIDMKE